MKKVGIIAGSLRRESFTKKIAKNITEYFPEDWEAEMIEIGHLPFYNQDFDDYDQVPEDLAKYRELLDTFDAFVFVTPEYNRSFSAVLKNAIDLGSRPPTNNLWSRKPAAVISQTPGNLGGFGAHHHLRQVLAGVNMRVLAHPEVYLSRVEDFLNEVGEITKEETAEFLQNFVKSFIQHADKNFDK